MEKDNCSIEFHSDKRRYADLIDGLGFEGNLSGKTDYIRAARR